MNNEIKRKKIIYKLMKKKSKLGLEILLKLACWYVNYSLFDFYF